MSKTLNFNTIKKQYLTVTLADEAQTTLMIGTPTKGVMNDLIVMQDTLGGIKEENDPELMDTLYLICARLMSCNKGGVKVNEKDLEKIMDLEDIIIFFNAYMTFIEEIKGTKN